MKIKLLQKLRKRIYIEQRNSSFRVVDKDIHPDSCSGWLDKDAAYDLRRFSILECARIYFVPKSIIK